MAALLVNEPTDLMKGDCAAIEPQCSRVGLSGGARGYGNIVVMKDKLRLFEGGVAWIVEGERNMQELTPFECKRP